LFHVSKHETLLVVLKGQDIVVLVKLLGASEPIPVRDLADQLRYDVAGTHRALRRLGEAGLYSSQRRRAIPARAEEFLVHAVKFLFPAQRGAEVRGIPTAWAAEPLKGELVESEGLPPVWPYAKGMVRGLRFEPLHAIVPRAVQQDPELAKRLALVDALRGSDSARVARLATRLLQESLRA
jgi:hypothetical protein